MTPNLTHNSAIELEGFSIEIGEIKAPEFTDSFVINIQCYAGDADYFDSHQVKIDSHNLPQLIQTVLEIEIMKTQFPTGRGGCRPFYNQTNYFRPEEDSSSDESQQISDNFWQWLEDYPYYEEGEQNMTLSRYRIAYYDALGDSSDVKIEIPAHIKKEIQDYNGNFLKLTKNRFDVDDEFYLNYRTGAVAIIEKALIHISTPNRSTTLTSTESLKKNKI